MGNSGLLNFGYFKTQTCIVLDILMKPNKYIYIYITPYI